MIGRETVSIAEYFLVTWIPRECHEMVRNDIVETMLKQLPVSAKVTYSGYSPKGLPFSESEEWIIVYVAPKQGYTQ
jgi:hypothetical protein